MKLYKILVLVLISMLIPNFIYAANNNNNNDKSYQGKKPSRGITFLMGFYVVSNVLKGGQGLEKQLSYIIDTETDLFGNLPFANFWFDVSTAHCLKQVDFDKHKYKPKEQAEKDFFDEVRVCREKYILDNWDLINETIRNRHKQLTDPEYLKQYKEKKKE